MAFEVINRLLAATPAYALAAHLFLVLRTPNTIYLVALITLAVSALLNRGLKHIASRVAPSVSKRPGVCGGEICNGCGVLPYARKGGFNHTWMLGMPSGHAQIIASLVGFYAVAAPTHAVLPVATLVITGVQRVTSKCHTPLQVAVGTAVGIALGVSSGLIATRL